MLGRDSNPTPTQQRADALRFTQELSQANSCYMYGHDDSTMWMKSVKLKYGI